MKPAVTKYRPWLPGLLTALGGAAYVRLLAPQLPDPARAGLTACGYLLVPIGLALIARQIRLHALKNDSIE